MGEYSEIPPPKLILVHCHYPYLVPPLHYNYHPYSNLSTIDQTGE